MIVMLPSIEKLSPSPLWKHFNNLCQIPRPSKHEQKAVNYLVNFAKQNKLDYTVDEVGNVIIRKQATRDLEDLKGVIFQTHIDMVPQKNNDTVHDFTKDPINAYVDGEWVTARGTTLGADNGIGVATALAILESGDDIAHGPLEALFTIDEETGMTGAKALKSGLLTGEIMLNLDTEEEGEIYVGCAGGMDIDATSSYQQENINDKDYTFLQLELKSLRGGHSGIDIEKGHANANKMIASLIKRLLPLSIRVASFVGGTLRNAIPREASVIIAVLNSNKEELLCIIDQCLKEFINEYKHIESSIVLNVSEATSQPVIPKQLVCNLLNAIDVCPSTALRMSSNFEGVVETSNNLGVVIIQNEEVKISCLTRSLLNSTIRTVSESIAGLFRMINLDTTISGFYPGWTPDIHSKALATTKQAFMNLYQKEAKVKVIHAGLECGLFSDSYPDIQMVSIGPTIRGAHSPDERVNIASVDRFWNLLKETLKGIPVVES